MSLQHPHPHRGPGDTWLMAIRDEPGRGWNAQSDLISSPKLYAVVPIKKLRSHAAPLSFPSHPQVPAQAPAVRERERGGSHSHRSSR